jgi:hypothetical protein
VTGGPGLPFKAVRPGLEDEAGPESNLSAKGSLSVSRYAGVTELLAGEVAEPTELVAVTVNVTATPVVRPVMVAVRVVPETVCGLPPTDGVTV